MSTATEVRRRRVGKPACHQCAEPATVQHQRHLTDDEYAALPENFLPIDGYAVKAEFSCDDHELEPICVHEVPPTANEIECPTCHAHPGAACVRADGRVMTRHHEARNPAQQPSPCRHAHRSDCGGYGACVCAADDPIPVREPRVITPAEPEPPVGLTAPLQASFTQWATGRGIDLSRLAAPVEPFIMQNNKPGLRFPLYVLDEDSVPVQDEHGRAVINTVELAIDAPPKPATPLA